jgi:hypothetical protein
MRCFGSEGPSFPATRDWDAGAAAAIGAGESLVPVSLCLTSRSTRCSSSVAAALASLRDGSMGQYLVPILMGVRPKCTDAQLQKTVMDKGGGGGEASPAVVIGGAGGHRHGRKLGTRVRCGRRLWIVCARER